MKTGPLHEEGRYTPKETMFQRIAEFFEALTSLVKEFEHQFKKERG